MLPGRSLWTAMPRLTARCVSLKADGSLPAETKLRSSKYLNNLIEQDHRGVKQRIRHDAGLQELRDRAAITIAGIGIDVHRIRNGTIRTGTSGSPLVDLRLQCGMPCSGKLEVSTVQHGTLSGCRAICTRATSRRADPG